MSFLKRYAVNVARVALVFVVGYLWLQGTLWLAEVLPLWGTVAVLGLTLVALVTAWQGEE